MTETVRNEQLKRAHSLADLGYSVFPVFPPDYRVEELRKTPRRKGWQDAATTDHAAIDKMWRENPGSWFGILMEGDMIVIDLDVKNGKNGILAWGFELPEAESQATFTRHATVRTLSGGQHLYRRTTNTYKDSTRPLGEEGGVDLKAPRGFTVAYEGALSLPPRAELPVLSDAEAEVLAASTKKDYSDRPPAAPIGRPVVEAVLRDACEAIENAEDRHLALNSWSFQVGQVVGDYLTFEDAQEALEEAWQKQTPEPEERGAGTIEDALIDGMGDHRLMDYEAGPWDPRPGDDFGVWEDGTKLAAPEPGAWQPRDLITAYEDLKAGKVPENKPEIMRRVDGLAMFAPGTTNAVSGPAGGGKTWLLLAAVAEVLADGYRALYFDYEEPNEYTAVRRLAKLGVTKEQFGRLTYITPEAAPRGEEFEQLLDQEYRIAIIDAVTGSMGKHGLPGDNISNDRHAVNRWAYEFPRLVASRTGAAVVQIDHVPKNTGNRGTATGSTAKAETLTGTDFSVVSGAGFGTGASGDFKVMVNEKDRPSVRGALIREGMRVNDYNQIQFAVARVTSHEDDEAEFPGGSISFTLEPPESDAKREEELAEDCQEKVYKAVKSQPGISQKELFRAVPGKEAKKRAALGFLSAEGYVLIDEQGRGKPNLHYPTKKVYAPGIGELAAPSEG